MARIWQGTGIQSCIGLERGQENGLKSISSASLQEAEDEGLQLSKATGLDGGGRARESTSAEVVSFPGESL